MKDNHIHTNLSHDGRSDMQGYIAAAADKNIDELTFTEHIDFRSDCPNGADSSIYIADIQKYRKLFEKFENVRYPKVNFGVEIGLRPETQKEINKITKKYNFDFIIASTHIVKGYAVSDDSGFFENKPLRSAYMTYFEETLKNISIYDDFDVYGHLDHIARYGAETPHQFDYEEFHEIIDEILTLLIKKDKGIEVNSSGFRYKTGAPHPNYTIIKRYKELGGKIITTGSDAHYAKDMGSFFKETHEIIKSAGFSEAAVFHGRKPVFYKL